MENCPELRFQTCKLSVVHLGTEQIQAIAVPPLIIERVHTAVGSTGPVELESDLKRFMAVDSTRTVNG